jgi:cytochrome b involved in lipid metabolism
MFECLRLYTPSVSVAPRQSTRPEGSKLGQYNIPPFTTIMCNFFAAHRHEDYWKNPEEFDAMRFNESQPGEPVSCIDFATEGFFPFGYGAHSCVGRQIAQLVCTIIIARLVGRFVVMPEEGSAPAVFNTTNSVQIFGFTEAVDGVRVNLVERPSCQFSSLNSDVSQTSTAAAKESQLSGDRTRVIDWEEIQQHTKPESLWIVLDGKVMDVTSFMRAHPGGEKVILNQAGKDVTRMFHDVIKHSEAAHKMSEKYIIGVAAARSKL